MHKALFKAMHGLPDETPQWRKSAEAALNAGTVVAAVAVGRWGMLVMREGVAHIRQRRAALTEAHLEQEQTGSHDLITETPIEYIGENVVAQHVVLDTAVQEETNTEEVEYDR